MTEANPMHITHFTDNGPVQTAYYDLAPQEDKGYDPFVMVHGFTGSKLDFANQIEWFNQRHRVVAIDQRGHGESSNLGPYNFYTLAHDLLNFLDQQNIERCHILGHSLGGMVVMRALIANQDRFKSALLMDTSPGPSGLLPAKLRQQLNKIVEKKGCEALLDGMLGQPQSEAVKRAINYLGEQEHWRRIRVKLTQMDPQAFVELGAILNEHPSVLDSLANIHIPTTIIVGENDTPFLQASKDMLNVLPQATLAKINYAAHSPQYENHEDWRAVIESHLTEFSK